MNNNNNFDIFDTLIPDDLIIKVDVEDERMKKILVIYIADMMGNDKQRISYINQLFYSNSAVLSKVIDIDHHAYSDATAFHIDITDIREEDLIRIIARMMCYPRTGLHHFRAIRYRNIGNREYLKPWPLIIKQSNSEEKELEPLAHLIYSIYPSNMSYQLIAKRICQRCRARTR